MLGSVASQHFKTLKRRFTDGIDENMSPFVFVPFVASVSIVVVAHLLTLGNMKRADELSSSGVYVVAKGVKIFVSCGTIALIAMPLLIGGDAPPLHDWLVYLAIDAMMVTTCLYTCRFRLDLKPSSFICRTLWLREINYANVSELKWFYSYKGNRYLVVVHDKNKKLKISDTVQKLDDFAEKLGHRVDEATGSPVSGGLRERK